MFVSFFIFYHGRSAYLSVLRLCKVTLSVLSQLFWRDSSASSSTEPSPTAGGRVGAAGPPNITSDYVSLSP